MAPTSWLIVVTDATTGKVLDRWYTHHKEHHERQLRIARQRYPLATIQVLCEKLKKISEGKVT